MNVKRLLYIEIQLIRVWLRWFISRLMRPWDPHHQHPWFLLQVLPLTKLPHPPTHNWKWWWRQAGAHLKETLTTWRRFTSGWSLLSTRFSLNHPLYTSRPPICFWVHRCHKSRGSWACLVMREAGKAGNHPCLCWFLLQAPYYVQEVLTCRSVGALWSPHSHRPPRLRAI